MSPRIRGDTNVSRKMRCKFRSQPGRNFMAPRFINPPTISKPPGYTHVVEIAGPGRMVYIAGQLGIDPAGTDGARLPRPDRAGVREFEECARGGRRELQGRREDQQLPRRHSGEHRHVPRSTRSVSQHGRATGEHRGWCPGAWRGPARCSRSRRSRRCSLRRYCARYPPSIASTCPVVIEAAGLAR